MDDTVIAAIITVIGGIAVAIITYIIGPTLIPWIKRNWSGDSNVGTRQQYRASPTPELGTEPPAQDETFKISVGPLFRGLDPDVFGRKPQLRQLDEAWDDD